MFDKLKAPRIDEKICNFEDSVLHTNEHEQRRNCKTQFAAVQGKHAMISDNESAECFLDNPAPAVLHMKQTSASKMSSFRNFTVSMFWKLSCKSHKSKMLVHAH